VTNDTLHDLMGAQVQSVVGDGARWRLSVRYSDEEGDLRGTAGALRLASERGLVDDVFSVVYGDSYLPCRAKAVWRRAASRRSLL
jgi:NDP-sugar pyrophosphorylase family protein